MHVSVARNGTLNCFCGQTFSPLKVKDLDSHDIKLGFRWLLAPPPPPIYDAPIIRKY